jgi:dihydropteroate synthase
MGILNITPDSFYSKSRITNKSELLNRVESMINDGADIIDMGAVSTRPGAENITEEEELNRLITNISSVLMEFPDTVISVDTFRSKVALESINAGAKIINDISGGTFDKNMFNIISKYKVPYILMHIHGTPSNMQLNPIKNDITNKVHSFFKDQISFLNKDFKNQIILDPGFGFGKSLNSNYKLLSELESIRINNYPILVGISRKSMINKVLGTKPEDALTGTISLNMIALQNGANILRVHDVKEASESIKLFNYYINNK